MRALLKRVFICIVMGYLSLRHRFFDIWLIWSWGLFFDRKFYFFQVDAFQLAHLADVLLHENLVVFTYKQLFLEWLGFVLIWDFLEVLRIVLEDYLRVAIWAQLRMLAFFVLWRGLSPVDSIVNIESVKIRGKDLAWRYFEAIVFLLPARLFIGQLAFFLCLSVLFVFAFMDINKSWLALPWSELRIDNLALPNRISQVDLLRNEYWRKSFLLKHRWLLSHIPVARPYNLTGSFILLCHELVFSVCDELKFIVNVSNPI